LRAAVHNNRTLIIYTHVRYIMAALRAPETLAIEWRLAVATSRELY